MFRHQGKTRTNTHNLKVASLLAFVAGLVNVAGYFSIQELTTNVTGHFAFFIDEIFKLNFLHALVYFFYILFFLLGSFCSGLILEIMSRKSERYMYVVPIAVEIIILVILAVTGNTLVKSNPEIIAFSLLFAMGLQNSLVTSISNSVVRTTHLTGLFTDLGIELSQLFFYTSTEEKQKLKSSIKLRLSIISFFFLGGITGGILFTKTGIHALLAAASVLVAGLIYDDLKFKIIYLKKKYVHSK